MTEPKLGQKLDPNALPERDAIHVALMPVICAAGYLSPGSHVGFVKGSRTHVSDTAAHKVGIVDPYFQEADYTLKGEACWLLLYPGTVTSLRHHWEHPGIDSLPDKDTQEAMEAWSRDWVAGLAERCGVSANVMLDDARKDTNGGPGGEPDTVPYKGVTPDEWELFWKHYAIITGEGREKDREREGFYNCGC